MLSAVTKTMTQFQPIDDQRKVYDLLKSKKWAIVCIQSHPGPINMDFVTRVMNDNFIKLLRHPMVIIFINHNKLNHHDKLELFRNNGTSNYASVFCKKSLVVLMPMFTTLIYRSRDKLTI